MRRNYLCLKNCNRKLYVVRDIFHLQLRTVANKNCVFKWYNLEKFEYTKGSINQATTQNPLQIKRQDKLNIKISIGGLILRDA